MKSAKKIFQTLLVVVIVALFSVFSFQNADHVTLRFVNSKSPEVPLFIVMIGCLLLGFLMAAIFSLAEILRLGRRNTKQQKQINNLEKQLNLMKQQPLLDEFQTQPEKESEQEKELSAEIR